MPIQWERYQKVTRYLDPRAGFTETEIACEIRRDPLTGRSGRVAHVLGFQLAPVDFDLIIERSRPGCPFCPERIFEVTPQFPPDIVPEAEGDEGRIRRGEAVVFPNLAPYDEYSAVVAMTRQHYVPLGEFTPLQLAEAFAAALAYFHLLQRQPRATYTQAFWNYLPASGGTQIHPHLQLFASDTPGNALEQELDASLRYARSEGRPYWLDLVEAEEQNGERFVARGSHSVWMTDFVSQSLLADVLVVFPEERTLLELPAEALGEFCQGLTQLLQHLQSRGVYSFNLAWYSATTDREDFRLHARLSPRVYMTPRIWGTDTSALQHLYQEHFMVQTPEMAAEMLRQALKF
jgi:UDPglucose--hexose-1-phosphate uridylyltransferase